MSTEVKLVGNIAGDPELKFAQSGTAWIRFTVVTSARFFNKETQKWEDKDTTFWRCVAFGKLAEHMGDSVSKGDRVVVLGMAKEERYKGQDGSEQKETRVTADEVAVSLKFGPIKAGTPAARPQANPVSDPWGTPAPF